VAGACLALAGALAACGTAVRAPAGDRIPGTRLTVYVSVPLQGVSAVAGQAVVQGATLALTQAGGRIGRYVVAIRALSDSTGTGGRWNPGQAEANARAAVRDTSTIAYIGDLDSGATAVVIPLLNRAGIAQVSPTSSAVGLTSDAPGAAPGEPVKYYPTGVRTFARVVPSDLVQARVQARVQRALGCRETYVLDDGEFDGDAAAAAFRAVAAERGPTVIAEQPYDPAAADFGGLARTVAQSHADCVLLAAIPDTGAARVAAQVAAEVPHALLFATSGLASGAFSDPALGGVPPWLDRRLFITAAAGGSTPPGGGARAFYAAYRSGPRPIEPAAVDGYAAMRLLLDAVRRATHGGHRAAVRTQVVRALFRVRERDGVLGPYRIERDGDPTVRGYGVYRIVRGRLRLASRG
jgi:branched-chain amino acid transport system substrate-binding protein